MFILMQSADAPSQQLSPLEQVTMTRSYKDFIKEDFISDLTMVDWTEVLVCIDLDQAVELFTRKFREVLNIHAPWIIGWVEN